MRQHDSCCSLELEAPGKPGWTAEGSKNSWLWADSSILGAFWWLDWLLRPWKYFTAMEPALNYLIAGRSRSVLHLGFVWDAFTPCTCCRRCLLGSHSVCDWQLC